MKLLQFTGWAGRFPILFCLSIFLPFLGQAQSELLYQKIPLNDLSPFRPAAGNWQVAGEVYFDRQNAKKRQLTPGQGILVNLPSSRDKDNLLTSMEHGDIELELEFLMAPGSNSGVYLQGRYEVQIYDSWGVQHPRYLDAGGIYERWDESRPSGQKGYQGHPPRVNASRAPGLWQHFQIVFEAPRFNEQGQKIASARFVKVILNGVTIHENVEVSGPTRSAAFNDEKPTGPLMLQGDHGPVAFRNIRYKTYGQEQVRLQGLQYKAYDGSFDQIPDFTALTPHRQGESDVFLHHIGNSPDRFAGQYTGVIEIPKTGVYQFDLNLGWISTDPHFSNQRTGAARLTIGDKEVLSHRGEAKSATGQAQLEAGEHPFTLSYFKRWGDKDLSISLYTEGPGVKRQKLNAPAAESPITPPGIITVSAEREPVMLRSFLNHGGKKRTHCISVAEPVGAHYSLDLRQGALLQIWRGDFMETTTMWHSRGDAQLAYPLGSVIQLSGQPSVAFLPKNDVAWPDSVQQGSTPFRFKGYLLDQEGRPNFSYQLGNLEVKERFVPADQGRQLQHELTFTGSGSGGNLWCRLAEGSSITRLRDGSYSVNDKQYYVSVPKSRGPKPVIRQVNGREELLVPVNLSGSPTSVSYSIVW